MIYKLSPSDFKFLWRQCKHCYYRKVRDGVAPPSGAFPAIFMYMNNLLQNHIEGRNLREIHAELPDAMVEKTEGFLKSAPITGAESCYISGRYDIICRLNDGSLMVIDFKITNPKEDSLAGYASQLHAYKYALEHPKNTATKPEEVSKFGLVTISPNDIRLHKGRVVFIANPVWHNFEVNMEGFFRLTSEIAEVLNGPLPEPSPSCKFCQYRQVNAVYNNVVTLKTAVEAQL